MIDPIFWLGLSILFVAVSLTAVLMVAIPAFKELARASRSAEKLFDTLNRELPPTLEAIRLTSLEITELTDDMSAGVQNAGQVAQQVNKGVSNVAHQAKQAGVTTRSMLVGVKAAWKTFNRSGQVNAAEDSEVGQLPASSTPEMEFESSDRPIDSREAHSSPETLASYEEARNPDPAPYPSARSPQNRQEEDIPR